MLHPQNTAIMKRIFTLIATLFIVTTSLAQIGGGWDWAFNTGSYGHDAKHIGYNANGDMLIVARTNAGAYLGSSTVTVPDLAAGTPGQLSYLAKISATGATTILKSFANPYFTFNVATNDAAGNFYVGMGYSAFNNTPIDLGNGVTLDGLSKVAIIKFSPTGTTLWAKSFDLGVVPGPGVATLEVLKIAVSAAGNIFFVGSTNNVTTSTDKYSIYKLDANGNTLWTKYSSLTLGAQQTNVDKDKFIDDDENVYLSSYGFSRTIVFNGETVTAPLTTIGGAAYSFYMSLDANGNKRWTYGFRGGITNLVVDKPTGNVYFGWVQTETNTNILTTIPAITLGGYPSYFTGIIKCDKAGNLLLGKYGANNTFFIPISGNRLLMGTKSAKGVALGYGVDYFFAADATYEYNIVTETDADLNITKAISGGKAITAGLSLLAAYGDTYGIVANFNTSTTALPTAVFGSTTLTGYNAIPNFTTLYPSPLYTTLRSDQAFVQCNSANFPTISATTWLGINTNWNDASNWTNGVPTASVKAVFNAGAANYPSTFTSPTSGTLEVNSGVNVTLPSTLTIAGAIKNEGTIKINSAGFFQGLGATEWKGNGTVEFLGSALTYFFMARPFTNSIVLNSSFNTFYDMAINGVTFNTTSGKFDMGNKIVNITNPSSTSIVGANATNYFTNGTLQRAIAATGTYEFPIGSSTNFQSAAVNANNLVGVTSLSVKFTAGAVTGTVPNTSLNGVPITSALNAGWYSIAPNTQPTSGMYNVSLNLRASTNSVTDAARYTVIKRDNSATAWAVQGTYNLATVNGTTVTAAVSGLTSFSDFAIGMGTTVLPVNFTSFIAKANGTTAQLHWATATETNNKGFNVQHSADGISYNNLGFVNGNANSTQNNSYAFAHASPTNGNNYYRLQQIDNDGKIAYSPVQVVNFSQLITALSVYPNPVISAINFNKNFAAGTTLQIVNSVGQVVENSVFGGNRYQPKAPLKGMYKIVIVDINNSRFAVNVLVQ